MRPSACSQVRWSRRSAQADAAGGHDWRARELSVRLLPPRSGDRRAWARFADGQPAAALPVPCQVTGAVEPAGPRMRAGVVAPADVLCTGGVVCAVVMRAGDGVLGSGEASSQAAAAMMPSPGIARVAAQATARRRPRRAAVLWCRPGGLAGMEVPFRLASGG